MSNTMRSILLTSFLTLSLGLTSCGGSQSDGADGLKALMTELRQAQLAGDTATAARITKDLVPDIARAKKALKDGAVAEKIVKFLSGLTGSDEAAAKALGTKKERTEVQVHAATTKEIATNAKGSVAYKEFPGGAVKAAQTVLKPDMTFYEVEFTEPGKDSGMKLHLFYWDGSQWTMLGPLWRAK